jgi:hypothetical protein
MSWGSVLLDVLAGAAIAAGVMYLVWLTIEMFQLWFLDQAEIDNPNELAFSVVTAMNEGKVKVVQGFINPAKQSLTKYRTIEAEQVDQDILEMHESGPVIYQ